MKIALLGAGKTGSKIVDVAQSHEVTIFTTDNRVTVDGLANHDVVISFLPGDALLAYIPLLIESGLPVVSGSTGFDWPSDIDIQLKKKGVAWVTSSNFALGMNLVKAMIQVLAKAQNLLPDVHFDLHEIHHIDKKDSPSGTAKSWAKWLGQSVEFSAERKGDAVGTHLLTMHSAFEDISVQHVAKDRAVFAAGAVWTAEYVLRNALTPGLHELSDIMQKEFELA